jgi:hypothetical protein
MRIKNTFLEKKAFKKSLGKKKLLRKAWAKKSF